MFELLQYIVREIANLTMQLMLHYSAGVYTTGILTLATAIGMVVGVIIAFIPFYFFVIRSPWLGPEEPSPLMGAVLLTMAAFRPIFGVLGLMLGITISMSIVVFGIQKYEDNFTEYKYAEQFVTDHMTGFGNRVWLIYRQHRGSIYSDFSRPEFTGKIITSEDGLPDDAEFIVIYPNDEETE